MLAPAMKARWTQTSLWAGRKLAPLTILHPRRLLQAARRRSVGESIRAATGVAIVMGVVWIALEYALRGESGSIHIDSTMVAGFGIGGAILGLATRARTTVAGELSVNFQMLLLVLLVVFLLPAVMLVVYGVATAMSAGVVGVSWALWVAGCILAFVLQVAVYLALVAIIRASASGGFWAVVVCASFYIGIVSVIGTRVGDSSLAAWDFSLTRWAYQRSELIPSWMFVVTRLRAFLAPVDHKLLMSLLASVGAGAVVALLAGLAVRGVRRRLVMSMHVRSFLPMAGAPLPDSVPLVDQKILLPLVTYSLIGWFVVLAVKLF